MSPNEQKNPRPENVSKVGEVRAGLLLGLLDFVVSSDLDGRKRLRQTFSSVELPRQAETLISKDIYLDGLARIDHFDQNDTIMLRAGMDLDFASIGLIGKAVIHSETIWEAIKLIQTSVAYFAEGIRLDVSIRRNRCRLTYYHPFGTDNEAALDVQYTIGLLCNVLSESAKMGAANVRVRYPGAHQSHAAVLGEDVSISKGEIGIVEFDDHILREPLKRSAVSFADVLVFAMREMPTVQNKKSEFSDLVSALQIASITCQRRPLERVEVANILDLPERTLQHRLTAEGNRFDLLRDKMRHDVARDLLLRGHGIEDVGESVGFSHRQSFSKAFSKWEGLSPTEFRSRGS